MTTQYTPYETQPPAPDPEPKRSSATKPLMIILAVIGGITLLVMLATTIFSATFGFSRGSAALAANTDGVTALDVRAAGSRFDVEFADVNEATLETSGIRADAWELTTHDATLVVDAPNRWWDWGPFWTGDDETRAVLTLPTELNDGNLDAKLDLDAGQLLATGDFDELTLNVNAGDAEVNGTASSLDAELNAGSANLALADVETAAFDVAAGRLDAELTGTPPTSTEIEVAAGQLDLTLPDAPYAVTSEVAAGDLDNRLNVVSDAESRIAVEIAAGNVVLDTTGAD